MSKRPVVSFGRHILNQIENGITKEWLETNGLGSYAMGTVVGANTRRYHALYTITLDPNLKRKVLVNRMEESLLIHSRRVDCSCQEYPGTIAPQGHLFLESFTYVPFPTWVYAVDDLKFEKKFFLLSGEETAVLIYKHLVGPQVKLILRPFLSCRDEHSLVREDERFKNAITIDEKQFLCKVGDLPQFSIRTFSSAPDSVKIYSDGYWYKNLVYAQEEEQELDYQEDLYSPGQFLADFSCGQQIAILFSQREKQELEVDSLIEAEIKIRNRALESFSISGDFAQRCALSADQFVIRRSNAIRILRGFPGVGDSMRESLMSLPGLLLACGRQEEAKLFLRQCVQRIEHGLLPDFFVEEGDASPEFSNADASLWFIRAIQKCWEATKEPEFLKEMKPAMEGIVRSFQEGIKISNQKVQLEIRLDSDHLLYAASPHQPLTWMNGQFGSWMPTPRKGKPVELQALYYNALQFASEVSLKFDGRDPGFAEQAKNVRESFNQLFWNSQNNYLYDVIDGNLREGSIRPNALYAISLPYEILLNERFKPVLETAWKMLYTSLGLRTLASNEPHFHGIYRGDERNRASALHNGTVYPYLIGPFLTAFFKTYGRSDETKEKAMLLLAPFSEHISDAGLGTISEIFDGNAPHNPRGCIADALSVAEILRVMKEEGLEL